MSSVLPAPVAHGTATRLTTGAVSFPAYCF